MIVKNDLFDYENRWIFQDTKGFKFSLDSILLAEYSRTNKDNLKILDLCAGNMAVGLILSTYTKSIIYGFEIQKCICNLAKKSIKYNKVDNLKIINDDVNNVANYFSYDFFDIMVCNPPYFKVDDCSYLNFNNKKKYARHEVSLSLDEIFAIAKKHLKTHGELYIVHRSERIDELILKASEYKVNVKEIVFISTKNGKDPLLVLIKCVKNSKKGVKIRNEICIDGLKTYKNIFKEKK